MQSRDTDDRAEQMRIARIRQMSTAQRVESIAQLSEDMRTIAIDGIRARHPDYSDSEVRRAFFRLLYGDALYRRVFPNAPLVAP